MLASTKYHKSSRVNAFRHLVYPSKGDHHARHTYPSGIIAFFSFIRPFKTLTPETHLPSPLTIILPITFREGGGGMNIFWNCRILTITICFENIQLQYESVNCQLSNIFTTSHNQLYSMSNHLLALSYIPFELTLVQYCF